MNRRLLLAAVTSFVIGTSAFVATPVNAQGAPGKGGITVPLLDTATADVILTVNRFVRSGDRILAAGTVTATVIDAATGVVSTVTRQVRIPLLLGPTTGTCDILNLVLGPLDLDLLGLQVHLNQVVLNIEAVPGAGNLLGNLLCAVAGLLDGSGPLAGITNLLNQILSALG